MYRIPRYKVTLVKEGYISSNEKKINNHYVAINVIREHIGNADRENFIAVLVNTKNVICGINTVSIGTLNSSLVHPREVFKPAVTSNAAAVILAHNHPSDDPTPSEEDREITKRLKDAGEILGITVLDHIIITEESYYSFKEEGHI